MDSPWSRALSSMAPGNGRCALFLFEFVDLPETQVPRPLS